MFGHRLIQGVSLISRSVCTISIALAIALAASCSLAAPVPSRATLSFEIRGLSGPPAGWGGSPFWTIALDSTFVHDGRYAARFERAASSPQNASVLMRKLPVTFSGDTLELRGWIKTQDVEGFAGLWLREDDSTGSLHVDDMHERKLEGTTAWTEYRVALPLDKRAKSVLFGAGLSGQGKMWVDELRFLVDGRPLVSVVDTDHEFDGGSRIDAMSLSKTQINNLVLLAKVWGFLKYHHPGVTTGKLHWDYELFRVLPSVLAAHDRKQAAS